MITVSPPFSWIAERWHVLSRSWVALWGKANQASVLQYRSLHPEHVWIFLNGHLLGTIHTQIPKGYCMCFFENQNKCHKDNVDIGSNPGLEIVSNSGNARYAAY
jgi:hypothetical protein